MVERQSIECPFGLIQIKTHAQSSGPWLTLLHTLATNSSLWDEQVEALSQDFQLLLVDMRGHGGSDASDSFASIDDLGSDVLAVWDALGVSHSIVIGLSIGGMIAISLGINQPERVTAIVAGGCRARTSDQFRTMWQARRKLLCDGGMDALVETTLPTWLTPATLRDRPKLVDRVSSMIRETSEIGYRQTTRALEELDLFDHLDKIEVPVLLVVGADDGPHPAEMAAINERIGTSELIVIPECSHLINLEQPDAFMTAVEPFLSKTIE